MNPNQTRGMGAVPSISGLREALQSQRTATEIATERTPLILCEVNDLRGYVGELDDATNRLEEMLQPVLSAPKPCDIAGKEALNPAATKMGEEIREIREHVRRIGSRVHELLSRLEV